MNIPFVIDNQQHRLSDALNDLFGQAVGKPVDIATAYFAISGYRMVRERLHQVGAFRLILGAEPHLGAEVGLKPNVEALKAWLRDPNAVKLGAKMPDYGLTEQQIDALVAYLYSLK